MRPKNVSLDPVSYTHLDVYKRQGNSLFNCHNENSKKRIEEFLERADAGEEEMFEVLNGKTGEREFFVPVKDASKKVIGYFERHEMFWSKDKPEAPIFEYWKSKN